MFKFAFKNMAIKKAKIVLIVISIVISACVGILAYNISEQVDSGFKTTAAYYDMIIGPSGSSTQLAMNTMFFTDKPLGTISYEYVEKLQKDTRVNKVVPFTMGDSYNGAKIVGTTADFLEGKEIDEGEMYTEKFQCVIGSAVAEKYGFSLGSSLVTSHGLTEGGHAHEGNPLKVVGILATTKTAYDNVIFTLCETVWATHDHSEEESEEAEHTEAHKEEEPQEHSHTSDDAHAHEESADTQGEHGEVCAILVKSKSFNAYSQISAEYGENSKLLVINPSEVLREVLENVDMSTQIVYILCIIILIMNNTVLGMVRQWQKLFYGSRFSQTDPRRATDFVKLAGAFGVTGMRITKSEEIVPTLKKAYDLKTTVVIDCLIDPDDNVLPMIPPGKTVNEIVTEM